MKITPMLLIAGLSVSSIAVAEDLGRRWSVQMAAGHSSPVGVSADFDDLWNPGLGFVVRTSYDFNRSFAVVGGLEFSHFPFKTHNGYNNNSRSSSQVVTGEATSIWSGSLSVKVIPARWVFAGGGPYLMLGASISRTSIGDVTLAWRSNDYCPPGFCSEQIPYPGRSHLIVFPFVGGGADISLGKGMAVFCEATLRIGRSGDHVVELHTPPGPSIDSRTSFSVISGLSFRP